MAQAMTAPVDSALEGAGYQPDAQNMHTQFASGQSSSEYSQTHYRPADDPAACDPAPPGVESAPPPPPPDSDQPPLPPPDLPGPETPSSQPPVPPYAEPQPSYAQQPYHPSHAAAPYPYPGQQPYAPPPAYAHYQPQPSYANPYAHSAPTDPYNPYSQAQPGAQAWHQPPTGAYAPAPTYAPPGLAPYAQASAYDPSASSYGYAPSPYAQPYAAAAAAPAYAPPYAQPAGQQAPGASAAQRPPSARAQQHAPLSFSLSANGRAPGPAPRPAAPATQPPPAAPGAPKREGYPDSLKEWIRRGFFTCKLKTDQEIVSAALKPIIQAAQASGDIWTRDWDTFPLPSVPLTAPAHPENPLVRRRSRSPSPSPRGYGQQARRSAWSPARHGGRSPDTSRYGSDDTPLRSKRARASPPSPQLTRKQQKAARARETQQTQRAQQSAADKARHAKKVGGGGAAAVAPGWTSSAQEAAAARRAARFAADPRGRAAAADGDEDDDWTGGDGVVVAGYCTDVEKAYLRLTGAPVAALVRPAPILEQALDRVVSLIAGKQRDYYYYWSQLKAIRQDLTVQRVTSALTVRAYEVHARAALEYGDMKEYNNCATQLGLLYEAGHPGCSAEFGAYRVLANSVQARCDAEGVTRSLRQTLAPAAGAAGSPEVRHAMAVRTALATANFAAFWRLYYTAPALGRSIMSQAARALRFAAVSTLVRAWKPSVPVPLCAKLLGFSVPEGATAPAADAPLPGCYAVTVPGGADPLPSADAALAACIECLREHGAVVTGTGAAAVLDCKASTGKVSLPEEKNAVAHGDANFSVDDFLSKV